MDLHLTGKTVLVAGASKGISAEIARSLAREGCNLRLVSRNEQALLSITNELTSEYDILVRHLSADLRNSNLVGQQLDLPSFSNAARPLLSQPEEIADIVTFSVSPRWVQMDHDIRACSRSATSNPHAISR